ncbi:hypothetical protein M4S82_11045 [Planococcus sp. MERTA32b]|nr:hypothetical protein [Planococcus sp. MER TA 32b]
MDKLIGRLTSEITQNRDVSIRKSDVWQLPVISYEVSFGRVKRLKMDILMKMLLFAFQQSEIRRAAVLADMLSVEELFVSDLIDKMQHTGLVLLGKKGYVLTPKGHDYLDKGIFEEGLDGEQAEISYSAAHDAYSLNETESPANEGEFPLYRFAVEKDTDEESMFELLANEKNSTEEGFQILVSGIDDFEELETVFIPCIEFQCYDQKQDILFARVWNTGTGAWDGKLEQQIEEHELVEWREAMKAEVEASGQ